MEVGIIGLPFVGKTTVFNALTRGDAAVGTFSASHSINQAVVKVPDSRLVRLTEIFTPKRITMASIHYIDIAGLSKGSMKKGSMDPQLLADLRQVEALTHVVRVFEDNNVPHVDGNVDPVRDIENLYLELTFADLQIIEHRLERIGIELRTHRNPTLQAESNALERCRTALEEGTPLRSLTWSDAEEKTLRGFQFLALKPLILVLNLGESQIGERDAILQQVRSAIGDQDEMVVFCALLEMEIAQLDDEDAAAFLEDMGLQEPALTRFIHVCYRRLGLQTFFTGGPREVRAWTIRAGSTALEAAGKIHSDIARGFIRAEVVSFDNLDACGSFAHAREQGKLRLEGKEYIVQDGDVITVRFNV